MLVSFKNELDQTVRTIICIKFTLYLNIWVYIILIFCVTKMCKVPLLEYDYSQVKTFVGLSGLQVEQATFIEHHFYYKECLMNYGYSDLGIW